MVKAIESKFANSISASYDYAIVKGKKLPRKEIVNSIREFIKFHYETADKESCLPMLKVTYSEFTEKFGKWNSEKWEVTDASLDLHSFIVDALFEIASEQLENGNSRIPCLKTNKNGVAMMVTVPSIYFSQYYDASVKAEETKAKAKATRDAKKAEKDAKELEEFGNGEELKENTLTFDLNNSQDALAMVIKAISIHGSDKNFMETIQAAIDNSIAIQLESLPSANIA